MKTSCEDQSRFLKSTRGPNAAVGFVCLNTEQLQAPRWNQWRCDNNAQILKRITETEEGGLFFTPAEYGPDRDRFRQCFQFRGRVLYDAY